MARSFRFLVALCVVLLGAGACTPKNGQETATGPAPSAGDEERAAHDGWLLIGDVPDAVTRFDGALAQARLTKRPVIVDFWAEWCTACKELDVRTWSAPEVKGELARFYRIKVDATSDSEPLLDIQRRFTVNSLPTVIFFDAAGTLLASPRLEEFADAQTVLPLLGAVH